MSLIFTKNDRDEMIGKLSDGNVFNIGKSTFLIYLTYNVNDTETFFDETKQKIISISSDSSEIDKYFNNNNHSIKIPKLIFSYLVCPDIKNSIKKEYFYWRYLFYNGNLIEFLNYFYYNLKNDNLNFI